MSLCHLLQNLKKQLAAEQQSGALLTDEVAALHQTVSRLTALAPGSTASADPKNTLSAIVSENLRLRADKSRLVHQVNEVQTSLSVENGQLSKMVCLSEALYCNRACLMTRVQQVDEQYSGVVLLCSTKLAADHLWQAARLPTQAMSLGNLVAREVAAIDILQKTVCILCRLMKLAGVLRLNVYVSVTYLVLHTYRRPLDIPQRMWRCLLLFIGPVNMWLESDWYVIMTCVFWSTWFDMVALDDMWLWEKHCVGIYCVLHWVSA